MATTDAYTTEMIEILSPCEAVRSRPGMYIGGTDRTAMHHMLWELVGNAIDEHLRGHATRVRIGVRGHRAAVEDDGRGIPPSAIEVVMTQLHAGTAAQPHVHLRANLSGCGAAAVCALSRSLDVTVWRDGRTFVQRFARGVARGPVEDRGPATRTGTRVSFVPDFTILQRSTWDVDTIARRCDELAALRPTLALSCNGESYRHAGLVDRVRCLAGDEHLLDPFVAQADEDGIAVDVAIAWTAADTSVLDTFVNCGRGDGAHVDGLFAALRTVLASRVRALRRLAPATFRSRIARGMIAMLHVRLAHPRFGDPTHAWLENEEAGALVRTVVERELARHLDATPALLDSILLQLERPAKRSPKA